MRNGTRWLGTSLSVEMELRITWGCLVGLKEGRTVLKIPIFLDYQLKHSLPGSLLRRLALKHPRPGKIAAPVVPSAAARGRSAQCGGVLLEKIVFEIKGGSETTVGWWREPSCCANWVVLRYLLGAVPRMGVHPRAAARLAGPRSGRCWLGFGAPVRSALLAFSLTFAF